MQDYTVFYQRKQSGDYIVSVPALGWNESAPTRAAAHQEIQEKIGTWFKAGQPADQNVEEDSEVLRLSGPDHMTVDVLKMSNTDQVDASEIGEFQYCQEAWRLKGGREQKRAKRKQEQKAEQKERRRRRGELYQFCQALWQLKARRKQKGAKRGGQRREDDARRQGSLDHEAWRKVWEGLSGVITWAGRVAAGAVGLGALGLTLVLLGLPIPRGPLGYANLIVEAAGALLMCALVVLVETWCCWYRAGFGRGWTISADKITLRSPALGLVGKPDRIVQRRGFIIPEEKKPQLKVYDNYEAQLGVYLVLVEEHYEVRPPYGFVVLGNGWRHKIKNTEDLRNKVKAIAQAIRTARTKPEQPLEGAVNPRQCQSCRVRAGCTVKPPGA